MTPKKMITSSLNSLGFECHLSRLEVGAAAAVSVGAVTDVSMGAVTDVSVGVASLYKSHEGSTQAEFEEAGRIESFCSWATILAWVNSEGASMVLVCTVTLVTWVGSDVATRISSDAIACVGARRTSVIKDGCMLKMMVGMAKSQSSSRKFGFLFVKVL